MKIIPTEYLVLNNDLCVGSYRGVSLQWLSLSHYTTQIMVLDKSYWPPNCPSFSQPWLNARLEAPPLQSSTKLPFMYIKLAWRWHWERGHVLFAMPWAGGGWDEVPFSQGVLLNYAKWPSHRPEDLGEWSVMADGLLVWNWFQPTLSSAAVSGNPTVSVGSEGLYIVSCLGLQRWHHRFRHTEHLFLPFWSRMLFLRQGFLPSGLTPLSLPIHKEEAHSPSLLPWMWDMHFLFASIHPS